MDADQLPDTRRAIVHALKTDGGATIAQLADRLGVSGEAVRQQLLQLLRDGFVDVAHRNEGASKPGRPAARYRLTSAGDHLFPKAYDGLAGDLLAAAAAHLGPEGLQKLLGSLTEDRAKVWEPKLQGLGVPERLEKLRAIYREPDAFAALEQHGGKLRLVERNCPYLNVAVQHPEVCAMTVGLLSRLLGAPVERVESFQQGHGRCVFEVASAAPPK